MTIQVTVRLPDEVVAFADAEVTAGTAASRADIVTRALRREMRRAAAVRDAQIYAEHGEDPQLAGLSGYAGRVDLDID